MVSQTKSPFGGMSARAQFATMREPVLPPHTPPASAAPVLCGNRRRAFRFLERGTPATSGPGRARGRACDLACTASRAPPVRAAAPAAEVNSGCRHRAPAPPYLESVKWSSQLGVRDCVKRPVCAMMQRVRRPGRRGAGYQGRALDPGGGIAPAPSLAGSL